MHCPRRRWYNFILLSRTVSTVKYLSTKSVIQWTNMVTFLQQSTPSEIFDPFQPKFVTLKDFGPYNDQVAILKIATEVFLRDSTANRKDASWQKDVHVQRTTNSLSFNPKFFKLLDHSIQKWFFNFHFVPILLRINSAWSPTRKIVTEVHAVQTLQSIPVSGYGLVIPFQKPLPGLSDLWNGCIGQDVRTRPYRHKAGVSCCFLTGQTRCRNLY